MGINGLDRPLHIRINDQFGKVRAFYKAKYTLTKGERVVVLGSKKEVAEYLGMTVANVSNYTCKYFKGKKKFKGWRIETSNIA